MWPTLISMETLFVADRGNIPEQWDLSCSTLASGSYDVLRLGCCSAEASLLAIERSSSTLISYDPGTKPSWLSDGRDVLESKFL